MKLARVVLFTVLTDWLIGWLHCSCIGANISICKIFMDYLSHQATVIAMKSLKSYVQLFVPYHLQRCHEMSKRKKVGSLFLSSSSSPRQQNPTTERVKRTKLSLSSPKRSVAKRKVHIQSCLRMLQLVRISEHWFAEQWIAWHLWPLSFVGYSPTTKKRAEYLKRIWFPDI